MSGNIPWPEHLGYRRALANWIEAHGISVADWITIMHGVEWEMADGTAVTTCRPEFIAPPIEPPPPVEPPPESPWAQYLLRQCDSPWGPTHLGDTLCAHTICSAGCYISNLGMAQRIYNIKADATPATVNADLGPTGFRDCNVLWSACPDALGIKISLIDTLAARAELAAGRVVMLRVLPADPPHFVLAVEDLGNGNYLILDPYTHGLCKLLDHYTGVRSWRRVENVGHPGPPPPPKAWMVGAHDKSGLDWMKANELKGCGLAHYCVQKDPVTLDLSAYHDAGILTIARLNWGYVGTGTMPRLEQRDAHVNALVHTILNSTGVDYWVLWNEVNNLSECPGFPNEPWLLTPEYVVETYNMVWDRVYQWANLAPPPIDPYYGPGSDNSVWTRYLWENIHGADFIALHAKTQTNKVSDVRSEERFRDDPLRWQYLHMRTFETSLAMIPAKYDHLPVFLEETNPQHKYESGGELGWLPENAAWVHETCDFLYEHPRVNAIIFYRKDIGAGDQDVFGMTQPLLDAVALECRKERCQAP